MNLDSLPSPSLRNVLLGLLAVVALVGAGLAVWQIADNALGGDDAVVSFDGRDLTTDEFTDIIEATGGDTAVVDTRQAGAVVNQFVFTVALAAELEARGRPSTAIDEAEALAGIDDPSFEPDSAVGVFVIATLREVRAQELLAREIAEAGEYDLPEYLCSSHILVETGEEAQEILRLLEDGADFATLALERSLDGSRATGGDLGCLSTASLVPEFGDGAREVGQGLTSPVRSQFGWHVIDVRSIGALTPENHPEIDEAEVASLVQGERAQQIEREALTQRDLITAAAYERTRSGVEIDPRIGEWNAEIRAVVPPGAGG